MLDGLAGFAAFPFHDDGAIDAEGDRRQEEASEVPMHPDLCHSAKAKGIAVGGEDEFGCLGQPPEKSGRFGLLQFGAALGMGGDPVGITTAAEESDKQYG
jgi:hypothetical protein